MCHMCAHPCLFWVGHSKCPTCLLEKKDLQQGGLGKRRSGLQEAYMVGIRVLCLNVKLGIQQLHGRPVMALNSHDWAINRGTLTFMSNTPVVNLWKSANTQTHSMDRTRSS